MKSSKRKLEYMAEYQKSPEEVEKRMARNRARYNAIKEGKVKKGDNKEVDHITPLSKGGSVELSNTRVVSAAKNRAWRKGKSSTKP